MARRGGEGGLRGNADTVKPPEPGAGSQTSIVLLSPGVVVVPATTVPLLSPGEVVVWATTVPLLFSMDEKEEEKVVSDSIVPSTSFSVVVWVALVDVVVVVLVIGHADGVGVIAVVVNPLH